MEKAWDSQGSTEVSKKLPFPGTSWQDRKGDFLGYVFILLLTYREYIYKIFLRRKCR